MNTRINPLAFTISEEDESKGLQNAPQPTKNTTNIATWKTHMLIPFLIANKLLALHGPYPKPKSSPERT